MSALVVFFSFEGNTKFIAGKIAETVGADIIALETSKEYPTNGLQKYFFGGKSVLFGEEPTLTNGPIDWASYETIFLGTPVWAGMYAPPVKTFLSQYKIEGKKIALFACHGGGGAKKCFQKLREALPQNEFIGEIEFFEPLKKNSAENAKIAAKWAAGLKV